MKPTHPAVLEAMRRRDAALWELLTVAKGSGLEPVIAPAVRVVLDPKLSEPEKADALRAHLARVRRCRVSRS